ncbi:hypothetical protein DRO45_00190 [Candidatus Bathyarchaeota archaeon]|nr:MAG: hypothetical protein DRO45_00190 [Candidatus Bathyarchaeota archaeon]
MDNVDKFKVWLFSFLSGSDFFIMIHAIRINNALLSALSGIGLCLTTFTVYDIFKKVEMESE